MDWITDNRYMALYVIDRSDRGLKLSRVAEEIETEFGEDLSPTTLAKSLQKILQMGLVQKDSNKVYYIDSSEASAIVDHLAEVRGIVKNSNGGDNDSN